MKSLKVNTQTLLQLLKKNKEIKNKNKLVSKLTPQEVRTVHKLAKHFIKGKIPVVKRNFTILKKRKKQIRRLANSKIKNINKTRHLIHQSGSGIIGLLAGAALSLLGTLLKK